MIRHSGLDLLGTRRGRVLLFGALYAAEGAPIGFIWWALPTILREKGAPVDALSLMTAILVLPWSLKFLWSPLMDMTSRGSQMLRKWIAGSQFVMGVAVLPLAWIEWTAGPGLFTLLLVVHAIAASTQDAAVDALAVHRVPPLERGAINGWMQTGMLLGRGILGGGSLFLMNTYGKEVVILLLLVVMWVPMGLLLTTQTEATGPSRFPPAEILRSWKASLRSVLADKRTLFGLLFVVLAGAGFEGLGSVAGPFLVDMGCTRDQIARFFGIDAIIAMAAGSIIGGKAADRFGRPTTVRISLLVVAVHALVLALYVNSRADSSGPVLLLMMTSFYGGIGCLLATSFSFLMDLTRPANAATQFSLFMAGTNLCESWSSAVMGPMVSRMGYPIGIAVMAVVSLCALPVLRRTAFFITDQLNAKEQEPS